jgi:flagellum-specific ATP synthase
MTDFGIYPPVHILNSASRVMNDIISQEHFKAVMKFRRLYTLLKENETLIRIGAYIQGSDAELDEAIEKKETMMRFIAQGAMYIERFDVTVEELTTIMGIEKKAT